MQDSLRVDLLCFTWVSSGLLDILDNLVCCLHSFPLRWGEPSRLLLLLTALAVCWSLDIGAGCLIVFGSLYLKVLSAVPVGLQALFVDHLLLLSLMLIYDVLGSSLRVFSWVLVGLTGSLVRCLSTFFWTMSGLGSFLGWCSLALIRPRSRSHQTFLRHLPIELLPLIVGLTLNVSRIDNVRIVRRTPAGFWLKPCVLRRRRVDQPWWHALELRHYVLVALPLWSMARWVAVTGTLEALVLAWCGGYLAFVETPGNGHLLTLWVEGRISRLIDSFVLIRLVLLFLR